MPEESPDGWEALVRVAAALGSRDRGAIVTALELAAVEAAPTAVDEVLLQSHLFIGFPDALNAMVLWRQVSGSEPPEATIESPEDWVERGARVCDTVYGGSYTKLRANVAALHPDLDKWMVTGGYGRVIGRPQLDLVTRELCIVALLAVWGAPRQLHSHLRGALNAGATPRSIDSALDIATTHLDPQSTGRVLDLWESIKARILP
ncbi:MAG TPA: carboxymuconolactone decarboxylase family protein [Longimicrobiaceae bacterium]|nr:carboxymuconolactone decarboxylase family protein [Longimicrobiaceae bacterium]